jgi:hypothetical protein
MLNASRDATGQTEMGGGCCQFGWVDSRQTSSNAMPPVAMRRHGPWIDLGSIGRKMNDNRFLQARTKLRINHPNKSAMNKIVRSTSATLCRIKSSDIHIQTCNRCSCLAAGKPLCSGCNI